MTDKLKLVMATNNAGKLREARAIAGDRLEILSLNDIGYHHDIPETAETLEGNALIKVRAIKDACGLDCFADDTGLIVDALGGAPGVYSARYAGEDCNPERNIDLLLKNLEGEEDRRARFRTCIALSLDGKEHLFEGTVEGRIAKERSGSHGFGYDPVFVPEETGVCFAEMDDEAKNSISHRGRALTAMMKWLGAICIVLIAVFNAKAAVTSDWNIHNTFDDKIENVFDTPTKTYFLVQGQLHDEKYTDTADKLCFLFCIDKESGEVRPYNTLNFLSGSLIRQASYNARKNYLFIIYDDKTIDILYDNGELYTLQDLKNYDTSLSKEVRSVSFDPESDRIYVTTDFGFIAINDKKKEIASSGIYGTPIDRMVRISDKLLILRDGAIYWDNADARHLGIGDFKSLDWNSGSGAYDLIGLSADKCLISKKKDGVESHYIVAWPTGADRPTAVGSGNYGGMSHVENKSGVLFSNSGEFIQIDRETGQRTILPKRSEDKYATGGSWDMKDFQMAMPRDGFYSLRLDGDKWTVSSETFRPNSPAAFRSNNLMWTKQHGMLVNTHGFNQNFRADLARNPILLSGLKDGEWSMYGLPYLDVATGYRLINPCGMAQDPDNPDIFYFGSVTNGLLRYNIKDGSSALQMTRSDDNPEYPGHVTLQSPYAEWSNRYLLLNPTFDSNGNLVVAHINTEATAKPEIWVWSPEARRASTAPETFQPFIRLKVSDITPLKTNLALPLTKTATRNMIAFFSFNKYGEPFAVYDHNGTIGTPTDDRQATMKSLYDNDGSVSYNYLYCAIEDPATGLVWVGSDNGVFTFDPAEVFSAPGKVSRIKVNRNDGTSLADYLLSGTAVNHISIDGQGRKWFSLSGGGLVCTTADGKTVIRELNTGNSMLPSDMVYASCYNPDNNSLMIATSAGLSEYYLSGQSGNSGTTTARAYPNPVRHDYYGWVTIDGLEDDCLVKISDSAGNIVRELGPASAGRVQWDVSGMNLERVPSGVYFVLASSADSGNYSEVSKILVINR